MVAPTEPDGNQDAGPRRPPAPGRIVSYRLTAAEAGRLGLAPGASVPLHVSRSAEGGGLDGDVAWPARGPRAAPLALRVEGAAHGAGPGQWSAPERPTAQPPRQRKQPARP